MAAQIAARQIRARLTAFAAELWNVPPEAVHFADGSVRAGNHTIGFKDLAGLARRGRIHLSAAGFYRTPEITWNRESQTGQPFYYFTYGAACSQVMIDTLTGELRVERVDILQDVGRSLNPAIDIGQVEGAFVQGMGWLTTEELVWDKAGRLSTHAPSTYKIPVASDVPADLRVTLRPGANPKPTIYRSKGIGEPPLMLAISVFSAIVDALHAIAPGRQVSLDAPATPERIALAAAALRS
jgi:xanthine dehydrogenase large subunit